MAVADYITKDDLKEALKEALKPIKDDLKAIKDDLKAVRKRVNQMYDALEQHGLPMPPLEP